MAERPDAVLLALGKRLVRGFFVLHKTSVNYHRGHPAMSGPVADMLATVREYARHREEASLAFQNDHLFAGEHRLKPDAAGWEAFFAVMRLMQRFGLGAVVFSPALAATELERWVFLFRDAEARGGDKLFGALQELMTAGGVAGIEVRPLTEAPKGRSETETDEKERSKAIYSRTIEVISEVMDDVKLGRSLKLRRSKRVVQGMIDLLLTAETNLLGLTTIRCHDEYTYNHSVNVGILAMAVGQRVGMQKGTLADLGMAAIFHDIGKSCVPLQILNKPGSFSPEEWAEMRRHPVYGVKELLKLKGVDALTARIMLGAFEHHRNADLSGYPEVPYPRGLSLFGRIIAIADCYDALTSARVYRRTADPPEVVLHYILARAGTQYDTILTKMFVNAIGVYPVGALCVLDSGELAVVVRANPDPERWELPVVKLVTTRGGGEIDGPEVDLAAPAERRRITGTLDALKHGIDVTRYFI